MKHRSQSALIDGMAEVAEHSTRPRDWHFAISILKQSLRPGWRPTQRQADIMGWIIQRFDESRDGAVVEQEGEARRFAI